MTQSERSSGSPILARGYLVWANGLPIPGAAIEIHEKSDQRLGQSVSGDGGYFAVPLDRRHGGQAGLRLLLRGGRCGRELYSAPLRIDADGRGGKSRFVVPARVRRDFTPTAVHIPRRDGGILSEGPRETIEKALNKRFAGQPEQLARSLALMRRSIPFLARVGELPAIAWRVLDGERPAAAQLRGLLLKLAGAGRQFSGGGGSSRFMSAAQAAYGGTGRPLPDSPMGFQGPCAFDPFGFAPVAVATLRIADSITDWEYLAGGLEVGLFGSGQFDSLFQGAQEFLGNGDDTDLLAGLLPGGLLPPAEPDYPEGPGLGDPYFDLDDCMIRPMECLAADVNVAILPDPDGQAYQITAISPDDACAGEQVEITGQFFGSEPQKVVFPKCEGSIVVDAVSWSENQVIAVVPEDATPGQLGLKIPRYTMQMCGHYITVSELGATLDFHGGRPWIDYLTVAGDTRGCLSHDQMLPIAWKACPDGITQVDLTVSLDGSEIVSELGLAAEDVYDLPALNVTTDARLEVSITAHLSAGNCGPRTLVRTFDVGVPPQLVIEGIEVTQGIQTFALGASGNNGVTMVAGKDTIVRVYVSADRNGFNGDLVQITGQLGVLRAPGDLLTLMPINGSSPDPAIDAPNPFIAAGPVGQIDRQVTDHTLNFRIPASSCEGSIALQAEVFAEICDPFPTATGNLGVQFTAVPPLPLRYIQVVDAGGGPITPGNCLFTLRRAVDVLPTTTDDLGAALSFVYSTLLDSTNDVGMYLIVMDLDDMHNLEWYEALGIFPDLNDIIALTADPNEVWVGITHALTRGMMAWPGGGNTVISASYQIADGWTGFASHRIKTAHEIGHALGLGHVQAVGDESCFGVGCEDLPNSGLLDEVAFDPFWNLAVPTPTFDFMSYARHRWITEDHWNRLFGRASA